MIKNNYKNMSVIIIKEKQSVFNLHSLNFVKRFLEVIAKCWNFCIGCANASMPTQDVCT